MYDDLPFFVDVPNVLLAQTHEEERQVRMCRQAVDSSYRIFNKFDPEKVGLFFAFSEMYGDFAQLLFRLSFIGRLGRSLAKCLRMRSGQSAPLNSSLCGIRMGTTKLREQRWCK